MTVLLISALAATARLEDFFTSRKGVTPTADESKDIEAELKLERRQVVSWFSNRRAKDEKLRKQPYTVISRTKPAESAPAESAPAESAPAESAPALVWCPVLFTKPAPPAPRPAEVAAPGPSTSE